MTLEPQIARALKDLGERDVGLGRLPSSATINEQTTRFREQFGPDVLRALDGDALLDLMHGRGNAESRCLMYWLEFKNDSEFETIQYGGIGGGSALKFGIYQRPTDGAWIGGSPSDQRVLSSDEAIAIARTQRDELIAGAAVLGSIDPAYTSDDTYAALQTSMDRAAPKLAGDGWAHKYWFLTSPHRIDPFHSPRYQRFHLLKLLQLPPDNVGILDFQAARFNCAGRFVEAARELGIELATLGRLLVQRNGDLHRYWRVGTTAGDTGKSYWEEMRDGSHIGVGFSRLGDLSSVITLDRRDAKDWIKGRLLEGHTDNAGLATRKAGELLNFARVMEENDIVLACDGQTVLGIGRVTGSYEFRENVQFRHTRPVQWLDLESWKMPETEALRTTAFELGRSAANLLELERRLAGQRGRPIPPPPPLPIPPLDPFSARAEAALRRKGQLILYGPPGTGKTYRAVALANELAARQVFQKRFADLSRAERERIADRDRFVRACTFHPGWGYEDFIEGLRPSTVDGHMVFEPRDGVFKQLCEDARKQPNRPFYLVIDEINRGDIPRIFGELLTVIELDKRARPITLPITAAEFTIPPNVFLIGTMNTADRSISLMDAALRRRFAFIELMPDSTLLADRRAGALTLGPWLDALNNRVRRHLKRDSRNLQVGHAYLMTPRPITSVAEFARVLRDEIIPLLEEYCYEDFPTLKEILGNALVDAESGRIREEIFDTSREGDLIQALSFEEMQPLTVDSDSGDDDLGSPEDQEGEQSAQT